MYPKEIECHKRWLLVRDDGNILYRGYISKPQGPNPKTLIPRGYRDYILTARK